MADIFDARKRSEVMSRIRSTGTKPESALYEIVRGILGHRWRIDRNVSGLPGQPDVLVPTLSLAVFADGCFFHCCPQHGRIPDTNREYWAPKLEGNVRRDRRNRERLRTLGYSVWRFWEHDFRAEKVEATRRILEGRLRRRVNAWREDGRPSRLYERRPR